jgi:hypothetical protein
MSVNGVVLMNHFLDRSAYRRIAGDDKEPEAIEYGVGARS